MKLGILQCDSVLDEYQNQFENYPQMFVSLFSQIKPELKYAIYDVKHGQYPAALAECDAYITTGSRDSVYNEPDWLPDFVAFIRNLHKNDIKLVGVCFVHQLIAAIFGGKAEKSSKGWGIGVATDEIYQSMPWMNHPLSTIRLIVSHQDQVTRLPENATLLAGNEFCPNFMYQYGDSILSIQGHPEFSKEYSETLMRHRAANIGETTVSDALETLKLPTDELVVAKWILNFLQL